MGTYTYGGDPAVSPAAEVRFLLGDTGAPWALTDQEIAYGLAKRSSPLAAAAYLARALASKTTNTPSVTVDGMSLGGTRSAQDWLFLAQQLEYQASISGDAAIPYLGGSASKSEAARLAQDPDRPVSILSELERDPP